MTSPLRVALVTTVAVLSAAPAFAQSRAELGAQNEALRLRVDRLEARMLTGDPAAERLMARVDTLETTIRTLRGEIERLSYERELAEAQFKNLEADVRLLQELSIRTKVHLDAVDLVASQNRPRVDDSYRAGPGQIDPIQGPPTSRIEEFSIPEGPTVLTPMGPDQLAQGRRLLEEGDFLGAENVLKQYLASNASGPSVGEAHFWLGESLFVQGLYNAAAESYITSMRTGASGDKAPDSLVKLGAALREMGQTGEACTALNSFDVQFPDAPQSARAKAARELSRTGC